MLRSWFSRGGDNSNKVDIAVPKTETNPSTDSGEDADADFWMTCLDDKENGAAGIPTPLSPESRRKRGPNIRSPEGTALAEKDENSNPLLSTKSEEENIVHQIFGQEHPASNAAPPYAASDESCAAGGSQTNGANEKTKASAGSNTTASTQHKQVAEDKDPYEWAYKVWRKKGLMNEKKVPLQATSSNVQRPKVSRSNSSSIQVIIEGFEDKATQFEALVTPRESFVNLQFNESKRGRLSLPAMPVAAKKEEEDHETFANILSQWRTKSDDKPNAHFLSPEQVITPWGTLLVPDNEVASPVPQKEVEQPQSPLQSPKSNKSDQEAQTRRPFISQASKLKDQFIKQRLQARARSRGRERTLSGEEGQQEARSHFHRNRSPPKSRSDFKTAVQQVLRRVEASPGLRSVSAPRPRYTSPLSGSRHTGNEASAKRPPLEVLPSEKTSVTLSKIANQSQLLGAKPAVQPRSHLRSMSVPRSLTKRERLPKSPDLQSEEALEKKIRGEFGGMRLSERKDPPERQGVLRVQDLLPQGSTFSVYGDETSPFPSQVEIYADDGGMSIADSKLTDMRTDCDSMDASVCPSFAGDSPWTRKVVSKLAKAQDGVDNQKPLDRPWHHDKLVNSIGNMKATEDGPCRCTTTVFSDKDELIDFFLPLMGAGCTCGKRPQGLRNPEEPTTLGNILRPWQVDFLAGFGIYRGDQMVKAHHRSAGAMSSALREYRKKKGLSPFRTKSCAMALQIWSKTSKAFVRSIRNQLTSGTKELKLPNTLYIISSFLEKLPVDGGAAMSSTASAASSSAGWSVTHSRTPPPLRRRRQTYTAARSSPMNLDY
jgi:hypothetical protein